MKQYSDYKKRFNIFLTALLLLLVSLFPVFNSSAQTAQDLKNKIGEKDSDITKLEQEIKAYQGELDNLGKEKNSLSKSVQELDLTKKKLVADSNVTQKKIDRTNLNITSLSSDIGSKESIISNSLISIGLEIQQTAEYEKSSVLETLLSRNDFTAIWNDIDNIATVREKMLENIATLRETKNQLENTRTQTINAKAELTSLQSKLGDQQKIVAQNANEKNKLLTQTKNSEANYQKLLKNRIAQRDAFEKELRDYEAQLQFILDPSKLPNAGVLSWPLSNIFITQLFGKTVDAKRLYASGTHNGVDFRASTGTPVMAMADGVVQGIGDTDLTCYGASFGKFVFIKYNNGLSSTFGHLSLIKAQSGQKVARGEVVGYSGSTGHVTGPHLHVSLYASQAVQMASKPSEACEGRIYSLPVAAVNAYLDAMYYLPPYTVNSSLLNNRPAE